MFCTILLKDQSKSPGLPVDGLSDAWKLCLGFREPSFQPCVLAALAKNASPERSWPEKFPSSRRIDISCYGMGVEKRCIIAFTICFSSCVKKQIQWEGFYSVFSDTENNFLFILSTFLFLISVLPLFFQYTHLYFSFSSLYQAECLIHMYFILLFCTLSYSLLFVHWYRMSFCYRLSEKAAPPFLPCTFHFYLSLLL